MEKSLDLGFCNFIFSSEDLNWEYEKKLIINSYKLNKKFLHLDIPKFNIKLVYSKTEFDKNWGNKTPDYVSAFAKNDNIVIIAYSIFSKETKWNKEKFEEALIHEINHLFYQELRNDEYDPLWLSEGLATFLQHKNKKGEYKLKIKLTKKKLSQSFEQMNEESYQIFTQFVEYLIFQYGKTKIINLIICLKNGDSLDSAFNKIYKKNFEELIKDGNRYQKIN